MAAKPMQASTVERMDVTPREAPSQRISMYTECPNCHTIFRIGPQQLKAANGRVRCGQCGTVFDGLASLMDNLPPDVPANDMSPNPRRESADRFTQQNAAALEEFQISGGRAQQSIARRTTAAPSAAPAAAPAPAPVAEKRSKPSEPKSRISAAASYADAPSKAYVLDDLGGPLLSEPSPPKPWLRYAMMITLILFLMFGGVAQYLYFKRSVLAAKYPEMRPYLEVACNRLADYFPCEISAPHDLKAMRLTQRDVRSHPNKANALMITATFVNEAPFQQSYPVLQLSFSDMNGTLIAQRRFQPQEYLTSDIRIEDGMKSNVPVKILLEIVDPGPTAVNYEFGFY